jgi:hypothetical protein
MSSKESSHTKANISDSPKDIIDVSIESTDDTFVEAVQHGVEGEGLDMDVIYKWSGIGVITVVVFVVVLIFYSQFALESAQNNASATSAYYEIEQITQEADERLNSYGVIDLEEGVYRIPIDEAINTLAVD